MIVPALHFEVVKGQVISVVSEWRTTILKWRLSGIDAQPMRY